MKRKVLSLIIIFIVACYSCYTAGWNVGKGDGYNMGHTVGVTEGKKQGYSEGRLSRDDEVGSLKLQNEALKNKPAEVQYVPVQTPQRSTYCSTHYYSMLDQASTTCF